MSDPWFGENWRCLSADVVANVDQLAAAIRIGAGLELFFSGSIGQKTLKISEQTQADILWADLTTGQPTETGWITIGDRLALNLRHVCAVERTVAGIRIHVNSVAAGADPRFVLDGEESAEVYRSFFQGGRKQLLAG